MRTPSLAQENRKEGAEPLIPGAFIVSRGPVGAHQFIAVTPQFAELHGLSVEEILRDASAVLSTIHPDDRQQFDRAIAISSDSLTDVAIRFRVHTRSGETRWLHAVSRPERDTNGITTWRGVCIDLTSEMEALDHLLLSVQRDEITSRLNESFSFKLISHPVAPPDIEWVQGEFERVTGHDVATLSRTLYSIIHPDDRHNFYLKVQSVRAGVETEAEFRIRTPEGEDRWLRGIARPLGPADDAGNVPILAVAQRLSHSRLAEEEAQLLRRRLRDVLSAMERPLAAVNHQWNIVYTNDAFSRFMAARGSVLGEGGFWELFPSSETAFEQKLKAALAQRQHAEFVAHLGDPQRPWRMVAHPSDDGLLIVFAPETDGQAALSQTQQAQRMEALGRFAGGVAHDFNNLLAVIVGYGSLLERATAEDDPRLEYIREMLGVAERATDITRQMLAFSPRRAVRLDAVDLNRLITDAREALIELLGPKITVSIELDPALPPAMGDRQELQRALFQLATNAKDAMPEGGSLKLRTFLSQGGEAGLAVSDNGCGMDFETRQRAFEPFFTTKARSRGTGLGLASVYGTVKRCQGQILLESEPGKGSTFTIHLPLAKSAPAGPQLAVRAQAGPANNLLLVAEDREEVRKMLTQTLEASGFRVLSAEEGAAALALFDQHRDEVAMLVTDVMMPGMDGVELGRQLMHRTSALPILYISGYTEGLIESLGRDAQLLLKPFQPSELIAKVKEMLGREVRKSE